jgi:hypothetical protein
MTASVPITLSGSSGLTTFIDEEDFDRVSIHLWFAHRVKTSRTIYAKAVRGGLTIYLHRLVMDAAAGQVVDHIDGDGLNNRKDNLRLVTHRENLEAGRLRRAKDELDRLFDEWQDRL